MFVFTSPSTTTTLYLHETIHVLMTTNLSMLFIELALNIGDRVSLMARRPHKAVGPMHTGYTLIRY